MFALLFLFGCATPESNSFCANKCEEVGGLFVSSDTVSGSVWCRCFFPEASK